MSEWYAECLVNNRCPSWSCLDGAVALTVDHWCGSQMKLWKLVSMGKVPKTRKLWPKVGPFHFPIRTFGVFDVNLYELVWSCSLCFGFCRFPISGFGWSGSSKPYTTSEGPHAWWTRMTLVLEPSHTFSYQSQTSKKRQSKYWWIMMNYYDI